MKIKTAVVLSLLAFGTSAQAAQVNVTFTKLTGITGGSPAGTAVYRADLSGIGIDVLSVSIQDASFGLGGASGRFSGFDLDAIKLSSSSVGTAAAADALAGLSVFDFSTLGTLFAPGAQRAPVDPKLFGTGPTGATVDNAVATLGDFDANSTTDPSAFGFVSMGDGGKLVFNLTSAVSPAGGLYLYIGEVGDNGEVAAGTITISDKPGSIPEVGLTASMLGLALAGLATARRLIS